LIPRAFVGSAIILTLIRRELGHIAHADELEVGGRDVDLYVRSSAS
jgi:hypothetical protein